MQDQNPTPPVRYSDEELAEFKRLIERKLGRAREELDFMQEQLNDFNENNSDDQGMDYVDDSSNYADMELLNTMISRQFQFISSLEKALNRVENKTYGICQVTGKLIDKKRLFLVPHATKSIEGKAIELEQQQQELAEKKAMPREMPPIEAREKEREEKKQPKIITKVIKKSGGVSKPKSKTDDDEDWEWADKSIVPPIDDDYEDDNYDDSDNDNSSMDEIPDEGGMDDGDDY